MAVSSITKQMKDIMRDDAGVGGNEQRLSQIVWILFLKIFDYKEQEWEITNPNYKPVIPEGYRWRDWATAKSKKEQLTGDDLIDFVNNKLFKVLSGDSIKDKNGDDLYLFENNSEQAMLVKEFIKSSSNFMQNGVLLRQLVNEFDDINFSDYNERHAFNDIYEQLLKGLQKDDGEFYTGRGITSLVVDKVKPQIGDKVADFACGTGGFLVDALKVIKSQNPTVEQLEIIQNSFYGVEKKKLPYMLCVTNMLLNDIEVPDIIHGNSLEKDVRKYTEDDKFDIILMNPPYGGSELDIVQKNFPAEIRSSETADLFMIEIMYRLKKNGKCGIVLPDSLLFGDENGQIALKKKLIKEFNLHTIIRLPSSCFAPYTSIATNLLFFDNTEQKTEYVWFYRYDLRDGINFSLTKNPMTRDKFSEIDEWWDNRVEIKDEKEDDSMTETWKAKKISVQEIEENGYSLDYCKYPSVEKIILSPEETLSKYLKEKDNIEQKLKGALNGIKDFIEGNNDANLINIKKMNQKSINLDKQFPEDLKNSIIQATLQGKMTEQDEKDRSIFKYIDDSKEQRKKLIKDKKIKKEKIEDISDDDELFDIPDNWKWCRLGEIAYLKMGKTPPRAEAQYWGNDYPWVSIADMIEDGHINTTKERISQEGFEKKFGSELSPIGTLIMSFKLTIGRVSILDIPCLHNEAIISIFPFCDKENILRNYLFKALPFMAKYGKTKNAIKGSTLNSKSLNNLLIPLPPLDEQKRIVEKLDKILPII